MENLRNILRQMFPVMTGEFKRKNGEAQYNMKVDACIRQIEMAVIASHTRTNPDMSDNACLLSEAIKQEIETALDAEAEAYRLQHATACDMIEAQEQLENAHYARMMGLVDCSEKSSLPDDFHDNDHDGHG